MPSISDTLNDSIARHRAGDVEAAECGYREILRRDPAHAEALHLLGVAATQRGEPHAAIEWFEQANANSEPSALLLNNMGTALRDAGRLDEAILQFQQAVRIAGEFAGARFNLANALEAQGRIDDAIAEYEAAVGNDPRMALAHFRLGCLRQTKGDAAAALASLAKADRLKPKSVPILLSLAQVQADLGRFDEAERTIRQLLRLDPAHAGGRELFARLTGHTSAPLPAKAPTPSCADDVAALLALAAESESAACYADAVAALQAVLQIDAANAEAHAALGRHAVEIGNAHEARAHFETVVQTSPDHLEARLQLSNLCDDAGEVEAAITHAREATRIAPHSALAWFGLGTLLKDHEQYAEAADCLPLALSCDRNCSEADHNLGIVLRSLGRHEEAIACFDRLIQLDASNAQAHLQRALTQLAMGELDVAWDEYEWRWQAEAERRRFDVPVWDGAPLKGKTLLVHGEQGVGDQIQFASCLPDTAARQGRVIVECEPRLVPLFARSFTGCDVVPQRDRHHREFDCEIPLGSLPRLFRRRLSDFPSESGFLRPDMAKTLRWRERLAERDGTLLVGISWRGGTRPGDVRSRSTALSDWQPVLSVPQVGFVNLQYGDVEAELDSCRSRYGSPVRYFKEADPLVDLDEFAALVAALDLVISIDNSTVHLAGAIGMPVWALLPFAADPRWMRETARSPWYPSVRLYRQPRPGDWGEVLAAVAGELKWKVRGRMGSR